MSEATVQARPPRHVGIIMDGNGRWAVQRNLHRTQGHREGIEAAKRVVLAAIDLGVEYLSLYAFSTENWRRAEDEVAFIMGLVARNLRDQYDFYRENRIKLYHSGDIERLPPEVRSEIIAVTEDTKEHDRIKVNLAVNYGGRNEIVRAVNRWLHSEGPEEWLDEQALAAHLDLPEFPDPDLIIRTGGEMRTSNFLLWQAAYAEFYFSDRLWPDWEQTDLKAAVEA
ncbi:MAG: polyprenyl diphosphate synthase, partial [Alkalispirochaetaceae bacterium]